jgi:fibronectin-binding autotransporter adhesin
MKLKMKSSKIVVQNCLLNFKINLKFFGVLILLILFFVSNFSHVVSTAYAAVGINNEINFQGKLVSSSGVDVPDSTYTVVFSLYNSSSGGTAIWTETDSVTTTTGIFQVELGANTTLPGNVNFNSSNLYLGIKVGTDAEMTPRIQFTAVPYAFNSSALDGVVATESATGFNLQGGTSSQSTLQVTTTGGVLTFQPGVAEGLTVQSNGAYGLTLDTGGSAAVNIGNNNATSFVFGKNSNNPSFNFYNGTSGFTVNGTGNVTLSSLSTADGLVYTLGSNGVLGQTAPTSGSQCLQSNSGNTAIAWVSCNGIGTNYWQSNLNALSPANITNDFLLGGTSTASARFAFTNNIGSGIPTASISANNGNNATYLTGAGVLGTTNGQSLTIGSGSTGNIQFYSTSNTITNAGNLTLAGTTGINLTGSSADINFTGTGSPNTITTAGNDPFAIMPNGTAGVGINTTSPLASLDVRNNLGTTPTASISGKTSSAELVVDQSGSGDIITASSSGATQFTISNNGTLELTTNSYAGCGALSTNVAGDVSCSPGGSSDNLGTIYAVTAPSGTNLTINFNGAANAAPASASGTITFPSNTTKLEIDTKGAGGGGGGVGGATTVVKDAGGGGEGGYASDLITSLANNYYVKVGGGGLGGAITGTNGSLGTSTCFGTSSIDACNGALVSATGGLGGVGTSAVGVVAGGASGIGSGGDTDLSGQPGFNSSTVASAAWGGAGGGISGAAAVTASGNGTNGLNGGGGSGGADITALATTRSGGNGGNGYIVFYIYTNSTNTTPTSADWYQYGNGVLAPLNLNSDVLIGGISTASADFAFMNVATGTPIASISADNGNNATYLSGNGTLGTTNGQSLTLGSGTTGNIQFYNSNNAVTSAGNLSLAGTTGITLSGSNAGLGFTGTGTDVISTANNSNLALMPGGTGEIGVNVSSSLLATMDIRGNNATTAAASVSATSNYAAVVTNNNGAGDIFTASKSGASKFTVLNNGNLQANNYNTNGGLLYTSGTSGVISQTASGSGTQCLLGGVIPTWGSCSTGTSNYWQQINGALTPSTLTNDLLLGATATASAEFAFTGVANNTPVASISAVTGSASNGLSLNGASSTIQSLNDKTLAIGGSSTGNIVIDSQSLLDLNTANNEAITTGAGLTTLGGALTVSGTGGETLNGANAGLTFTNGTSVISSTGTALQINGFQLGGTENANNNNITNVNQLGFGTNNLQLSGNNIQTTGLNNNLTLAANGSGSILLTSNALSGVQIGSSVATTPIAPLYINGGIGNNGALIVNNTNSGDLIDASASGTTKFQVSNGGNVTAGTYNGNTITAGTGILTLNTNTLSVTGNTSLNQSLLSTSNVTFNNVTDSTLADNAAVYTNGSGQLTTGAPTSGQLGYLQRNNGAVAPAYITDDLLLGGTSTASARFAFTNDSGNGTPTASISANNGANATYLSGNGTLGTTNGQSLTLGSGTTGNVQFYNSNNAVTSAGNLSLAGTIGINLSGNGAGLGFTGTGTDVISTANNSNLALMPGGTGEIGVNVSSSLLATMDIRGNNATTAIASVSGNTNFAGVVVNNSGTGDIFTASKSGASKFTVLNNGNLQANNYNTNGGLLYTSGTSGLISQTASGSGLQCLLGGATPTWGSCALGTNEWQQINGAVSPTTITDDVLMGGTSTASARFAFTNDVGTGTPTASISANSGANATYLTGAGVLGTTNAQTMTIGSASSGNILINSPSLLSLDTTNNAAINTGTGLTTLGGGLTVDGTTVNVGNGSAATIQTNSGNANLSFSANGSGTIQLNSTYQSGVEIGGGVGNPKAPLYINGGIGNNGALIVNNNNNGDIIDASASGTTKFQVGNSGNITATGSLTGLTALTSSGAITLSSLNTALGLVYTLGSNGALAQTAPITGLTCLQSNTTNSALQWVSCSSLGTNFWQSNNGAISPVNEQNDFLLGSTATASADFAVTGLDGLTPIASISAANGGDKNGISLNASTATIQSLNNNTLVIGGNTTGSIQLASNTIQLSGSAPVIASTNALQLSGGTNTLTLQGATGGNIQFFNNASDAITSTGNLSLTGTTGITLSGNNAGLGFTGTGADLISTLNNSNLALMPGGTGDVGVNASAGLLATFDVRGNNATTAIASISGKTNFAALVVNNSGSGDLFTASSAGATKFTIKNSGSVVFGGNDTTISASGSGATNNGSGVVENDLGDEGSLVPNAGFEAFNNLGGFADDWVASSTNSATVSRDTTSEAKGNASAKVLTSAVTQVAAFYSACLPLALTNAAGASLGGYDLSYYDRIPVATTLLTVRAYVDGYTSEANCNQNNSAVVSNPISTSSLQGNITWNQVPGAAVAFAGTPASLTWGRVHFFVADGATGAQVNIDGVRLIEAATTDGLDYAEDYPADPNEIPQPGQVVSLEESGDNTYVVASHVAMDQGVVGVISTNPGYVLNDGSMTNPVPVGLAGRVPVNVSTANGLIQVGDYLTSSTTPGVAVKATGAGQVIGTAMTADTDSNTTDITQITMFIKDTYYNGSSSSSDSGLSLLSGSQDTSDLLTLVQDVADASGSAITSLTAGQVSAGLTELVAAIKSQITSSGSASQVVTSSSSATGNNISNIGNILTLDGLTVSNYATDSGDLRVEGNGLIEGVLHIVDTLFANDFIANGVSDFFGNVIFHSDVTFSNSPVYNSDTAGIAIIKKGSDHVDVTFSKPYDQAPMINASITVNQITPSPSETQDEIQQQQNEIEKMLLADDIRFVITNKTANGFTLLLSQPANEDIAFSWLAIEVQNPVIFQSDEQNQPSSSPTIDISPTPLVTITPTNTATTSASQ